MSSKCLVAACACLALAACASPQEQRERRQARAASQFLEQVGSIGDPGRVAAADIAFARMARDEGQWTAFREYAAPGALIHGVNGPIPASPWLAQQTDPPASVSWTPNTVWASCDGTLAVTFGRFQEPEGRVGSYVSVWELQDDNSYRYTYDLGAPDDPQPPAPPPEEEVPEDAIVVPGLTAINGMVADCPRETETDFPRLGPVTPRPRTAASGGARSRDGTLAWLWQHGEDGTRSVSVDWIREGEVRQAIELVVPASR